MAVGAVEAFVICYIEFIPVDDSLRKHQRLYLPAKILIGIFISALTMTFKAPLILFTERRNI
jgi:hypothetical protein